MQGRLVEPIRDEVLSESLARRAEIDVTSDTDDEAAGGMTGSLT